MLFPGVSHAAQIATSRPCTTSLTGNGAGCHADHGEVEKVAIADAKSEATHSAPEDDSPPKLTSPPSTVPSTIPYKADLGYIPHQVDEVFHNLKPYEEHMSKEDLRDLNKCKHRYEKNCLKV